ncbi:serine hydrolase domain-containing protein [Streptomonospora nanhaiensis]|uniref:CubicO group peptidase (Beta-lactamase class C family) n=1 Tax=Streptomonospora nanhaiensis TaxID=1323731 RepID=A0A853BVI3_9ACTN|nr:serine hydrolase domain-containing protein [Streptomonospora nanhaiensis]MBV2364852.1 beta-lactamase family protein [Streptomonospora nanhaiensis]MBX9387180.1 beta-lactamase family protein [Streptomonospora nanhaiensis]NYI98796.1 CubicO group peptidase (beta-lactamase class C family) [Streptomonospora nanhaiensis]
MSDIDVHGTVTGGFEAVREEFAAAVAGERGPGRAGAQLAVYVHGRQVVDLWAGDEVTGGTLTGVYSATKGAATLVVALLVQDGALELDRPVAHYWPEFAAKGKDRITVRDVLTHRSGVIGVDGGLTADELADDRVIARRLAGQRPYWRPGSAYGYGGFVTFAVVNEVVRRATGRPLREHFEERVRAPHGLDLYLGLPEALEDRFREVLPGLASPEELAAFWANVPGPHSITGIGYGLNSTPPLDQVAFLNTRRVRALGQSSAGGVGSARGLARMYAAAVWGVDGAAPLLTPDTLGEFAMLHSTGGDLVTGEAGQYALGFQAKGLRYPFLSANSFGHNGSAGAESFADPRAGIAFGYTRRRFSFDWSYPEHDRLAAAVHRAATGA